MANFSPIPAKALTVEKCHERFSRMPFWEKNSVSEEEEEELGVQRGCEGGARGVQGAPLVYAEHLWTV